MATAQELFTEMMRTQIAPALRAMGFKGSGQVYTLPDIGHWVLVGFQRSAYSDRSNLRFTVNLTVASREVWARRRADHAWLPARPSANTSYGQGIWQARIGTLMPEGQDKWWRIIPDARAAFVAAEVIAAINDYAMPAIRSMLG